MSLEFIIDGYNVINHPLFIPPKKIKDIKLALLEFIYRERLCGSLKNKISIVFDGYPDMQGLKEVDANINIIFSRQESADEKIKKLVEKSGNPKILVVVSDDREIKFFIKSLGAKHVGVEEFINSKKRPKPADIDGSLKIELTYSQMANINKELSKIWLKQ